MFEVIEWCGMLLQSQSTQLTDKQSKTRLLMQKQQPCEEDFETIKLISNGAYG